MSFAISSASFLRPQGEPSLEARFREEYYQEQGATRPRRKRHLVDAAVVDLLRATELASVHGYAVAR